MGAVTHILVDGSNLIHAWPELRGLLSRDKSVARERLVSSVTALWPSACERLTIVFDGRGQDLVVEHPVGSDAVAVIYTPAGLTADDVIERLIGRAADASSCLVATGDQAERATVEASGAAWCTPEELAARVAKAGDVQSLRMDRIKKENARGWKRR